MFARWHFAFILAFQLIMFANCQTRPVNSVCNLQDLCTCDHSLPEKATTLNCDCAKSFLIKTVIVRREETSFPRSLKTIRISNCDSLTVADNVEMPDDISEVFIKSVKNVIINFSNFRRIANLTFQDVSQLEITQNPFGHTLHADNILFRNVSLKCPMMTPLMTPIVSFLVSKRFEAIDSHFGTNAKTDIVGSVEKRLSVINTNCTTQTFRAFVSAHTVEMRRNRFNEDDCDFFDALEICTNSLVSFTGSLKLAENYYKNMMMPDLVIDGRNITLDLYPDRELKNSTKTTAVAAMQFFTLFNYEGEDDGRVPSDDRVINERGCRTSSSNLKPKYRNSTRQYTCDTVADLKRQVVSYDFFSDFTINFAEYLVSN